MQLNISYDSTTLAIAPSAFFSAVNYVVALFDRTFANNSTINIEVGYGTFPEDGSPVAPLGESDQNNVVFGNYAGVRQVLLNEGAPGAHTLPSSAPLDGSLILGSAQQKALGLVGADTRLDGWVGVASNDELLTTAGGSWSFDPTATPELNQFYLVGVLEHEFTEVMGRTSYLTAPGQFGVMDLYRYAAPGVRQTGTGDPAYFSTDGGNHNLDNFNDPAISGGDLGDWASGPGPGGRFNFTFAGTDAFLSESPPGQLNALSATDLTLMAALGWNATPPRPGNQYLFSAPGRTVNLVSTNDGNFLPAAVAGKFNIELVTEPVGTAYALPTGYQAVAILPGGTGRTLQLLSGTDLAISDTGSGNAIALGPGAATVTGGKGDTITGGGALSVDGSQGSQRIVAGSAGFTVTGGVGDTIVGGAGSARIDAGAGGQQIAAGGGSTTVLMGPGDSIAGNGPMTVAGGGGSDMSIAGGDGGLAAFAFLGSGNSVAGGAGITFIDDSYAGSAGGNTLSGGLGGSNFVAGSKGDSLVGAGGPVTILDSAVSGGQTVIGGSGLSVIVEGRSGDSIVAGSGLFAFIAATDSSTIRGGSNPLGVTDIYALGKGNLVTGGAGTLVVGAAASNSTIVGGAGNLQVFGVGAGDSVVGSSNGTTTINDVTGGGATLIGGVGATTVIAGANDSIVGGAGGMEVRLRSDVAGSATIDLSAGADILRDTDVGGAGIAATVSGFDTAIDKVASADSGATLVAAATHDGGGNVILHFSDNSTMTLLGVSDAGTIAFIA